MTVADRLNNPGNLKDPSTGTFQSFPTPQAGYAALLNDVQSKITGTSTTGLNGNSTLYDFAKTYAPSSDNNDPAQYTANLANTLGIAPNTPLSQLQPYIGQFVQAIAKNEGYTSAQNFQASLNLSAGQSPTPQPTTPTSSAPFQYQSGESPLTAGLQAIGNTPSSIVNAAKGVAGVLNPVNTLSTLSQIPQAFGDLVNQNGGGLGGFLKAIGQTAEEIPQSVYKMLVPQAAQQLISGDVSGAAKTMTEDPFGQALQGYMLAEGGAKAIDTVGGTNLAESVNNAVDKTVQVIKPALDIAKAPISAIASGAGTLTRSIVSHLTGLDPQTITNIVSDPQTFKTIATDQVNRGGIVGDVLSGLRDLQNSYSESGDAYNQIRTNPALVRSPDGMVTLPENFIQNILENGTENGIKFGLNVEPIEAPVKAGEIQMNPQEPLGYKVSAGTDSFTRNPADINAIQKFVDTWGNKTQLTANEFLNMRSDMAKMAKYGRDLGTNTDASLVGKAMRAELNRAVRPQISGLKTLDEQSAPQIDTIKRVKKDLFNGDGTLKDNASSKIANSLNKEGLLSRLEKVKPGITKQLQVLKAVEDIEKAKGIKVGNYTRAMVEGGGLLTGNIPAIVAGIITNPSVAVPLLRGYGVTLAQAGRIGAYLSTIGGDINNLRTPEVLKKIGLQ